MTSAEKQGGLPTWAKVLIGIVVLLLVGGGALIIGGVIFMQDFARKSQDPVAITKVAQSMAGFPNPLPPGYQYSMGFDMAGIKTVTLEHPADKQLLIMMSFPKREKKPVKEIVQEMYEKGVQTPQASARFEQVKEKGEETVAGESMPYIIGQLVDNAGNKFDGMVSCLVSKDNEKTIFIYGLQQPGSPYNLQTTTSLLKQLKGI